MPNERRPEATNGRLGTDIDVQGKNICITAIVACGVLAAIFDKSEGMLPQPWATISAVAGWTYFAAWSLSFYPQVYSNWLRKSVVGLSFDFAYTNVLGFACLSIYYSAFLLNGGVREAYRRAHNGSQNSVRVNDVFFAVHALLLTTLTVGQIYIYDRGNQRSSTLCRCFLGASIALIVIYAGVLAALPESTSVLGFLYALSYIKVVVTASKYVPQALLNFRRKSTVGFSVGQVILDFTGGVLSLFQLVLEAFLLKDISLITGDMVKLLLALLSLVYDSLLLTQHYILYPERPSALSPSARQYDSESDHERLVGPKRDEELAERV